MLIFAIAFVLLVIIAFIYVKFKISTNGNSRRRRIRASPGKNELREYARKKGLLQDAVSGAQRQRRYEEFITLSDLLSELENKA
jgi:hypothetical protein